MLFGVFALGPKLTFRSPLVLPEAEIEGGRAGGYDLGVLIDLEIIKSGEKVFPLPPGKRTTCR